MARKILAIGAHPDDIEFYAGGTLAKMAGEGELIFVIATDGRNGTHDKNNLIKLAQKRRFEQEKAAKIIGAKKIIYLNFKDGGLERETTALKAKILKILLAEKPDLIFTFDPERQFMVHDDFHPDHRTLALAVMDVVLIDSTLPARGGSSTFKPTIYLYNSYKPNKRVAIKKTLNIKLRALRAFVSQDEVLTKQQLISSTSFEKFRVYENP